MAAKQTKWLGDPEDDPLNIDVIMTARALMNAGEFELGHQLLIADLNYARSLVKANLETIRKYRVAR